MALSLVIQLILLGVTGALFGAAFLLGRAHIRAVSSQGADSLPHQASMGGAARALVGVAMILGIALLAWRAASQQTWALPVSQPLDAFLLLGLLLSLVLIYFRWTPHLQGLSFYLLPMIVALLALGLALAAIHQSNRVAGERQDYRNVWTLVHMIAIVGGSVCFALGCVGGIVYLFADRQLRQKGTVDRAHRWKGFPPLASVEKFNQRMVYCGFPLLSLAAVAGILRIIEDSQHKPSTAEITLGTLSWLIYAILLHVPLNPRFRGPRAAWLSIAGFALFIGAFVTARWS
jgi:ABC-type uncharacterized transport system permease subunit